MTPNSVRTTTAPSRSIRRCSERSRTTPTRGSALDRAKLRAAQDHFVKGRRLAALGKFDEALVEYGLAAELNPSSADIDQELRATRNRLRTKIATPADGKTELQTLIDRSQAFAPPGLDLPPDVKMPASLVFRDASSRDVFTAIARFANISLVFDPTFRDTSVSVDLRNASLEDALATVNGVTRTFFNVTAPNTIVIVPDTQAKRREYEEEIVRTFYLSNADLKETMDLLRLVLDARRVSVITATNALTIKDTPARVDRGGPPGLGDRQGAAGSHHRRRTARSRPDQAARIWAADRVARLTRHRRFGQRQPAERGDAHPRGAA